MSSLPTSASELAFVKLSLIELPVATAIWILNVFDFLMLGC